MHHGPVGVDIFELCHDSSHSFQMPLLSAALRVLALAATTLARPCTEDAPLVSLDYGIFQDFDSAQGTESFLGVSFAQPPLVRAVPILPHGFSYSTVWGSFASTSLCLPSRSWVFEMRLGSETLVHSSPSLVLMGHSQTTLGSRE